MWLQKPTFFWCWFSIILMHMFNNRADKMAVLKVKYVHSQSECARINTLILLTSRTLCV